MKISQLFLAAGLAGVVSSSLGYVREFDNGIPLAWVKDRTVVMQLSLGTGTRILRDGFTSLTIPPLTRSRPGTRISHIFNFPG